MPVELFTDANFAERVAQRSGVVLVDFWAPSCTPCPAVDAIIEKLTRQFEGQVRAGKLNVDEQPLTARRYLITTLPSVAIFRDGQLIHTLIGVQPDYVYQQALEAVLQSAASSTAREDRSTGAKPQHSVTVFSTPTCPWCSRLKAYLRQRNIPFKDIDVSRDTQAAQEMVRRSGQMGVPQAWIDGQVVVGFDRTRIDALLGLTERHSPERDKRRKQKGQRA
jgi:thioredoxin